MFSRIKQFFSPPTLENELQTRIARILNVMLLVTFAATVIGTAVVIPLEPEEWVFNILFGLIISIAILALRRQMYKGRLGIVIHAVALVIWLGVTVLLVTGGGTRDPSLTAFFLVIVIASLSMEGRGAIIFGILTLVTSLVLIIADMMGIISYTSNPNSIVDMVTLTTTIGLTSLLGYTAIRGMNQGLRQARENEMAQIQANRELQKIGETLEQRIAVRTRDLERRAIQLRAAAEVGRAAASIRDLNELLTQVTKLISERFGFYHAGIFLLDGKGEYAVLKAANSEGGQRMLDRKHRLKVGQVGIVGFVVERREPRVALDVGKDAVFFDNPDLPETRSEMALPLVVGDVMLGALDVQSKQEDAFTGDDIAILQILADQVAVAIENARLFAEQQESLEVTQRTYDDMSRTSWREFLSTHPEIGFISTSDVEILPPKKELTPGMIEAAQKQDVVQIDNSSIAIPIILRGQVLGVVRLKKPDGSSPWTEDEIDLIETLTDQLEVALESARLYRDTQQRALQERITSEITTRIHETLDPDTVLKTALREFGDRFGFTDIEVRMKPPEKVD